MNRTRGSLDLSPADLEPCDADRLDVRASGSGCAQRAWPYYEADCLVDFDSRWRGEPRKVRLVTTDRIN